MNRREDLGKRLYEACLSGSVRELDLLIEEDQLILDRVSSFTHFFNDTPLHVAALRGHLDFTKALLTRKPKLASELDSLRCSPLHLASTEGHVEVVRELLRLNTDVCLARDQDGRIPLHWAAMKGRVDIIRELLGAKPKSIQEKLSRGETVLHLCVEYNRLEALKTLVQYVQSNGMESLLNSGDTNGNTILHVHSNGMGSLLNSEDDDGNTILHLAVALKQMDTIEYLLGIESVKNHANVKNQKGSTALDVVEDCPNKDSKTTKIRKLLIRAGVRTSSHGGLDPNPESPSDIPPPLPSQRRCKAGVILQCIYRFWVKYFKPDPTWLQQVRGHLITAATVTATLAYQAISSPPGGFREEAAPPGVADSPAAPLGVADHSGEAVLDLYEYPYLGFQPLNVYLVFNTVVLMASLCTIMLALSGFPNPNKFLIWLLIFTVYITLSCLALSYAVVISIVFPVKIPQIFGTATVLFYCFIATCGCIVLLHVCHFLVWLRNKFGNLVKAFHRCRGPKALGTHNPAGSRKCLGNFC